jgi:hypothetical protein
MTVKDDGRPDLGESLALAVKDERGAGVNAQPRLGLHRVNQDVR